MADAPIHNSVPTPPVPPLICPQCHQPVQPEFYYCPNCGKKLSEPGLSTTLGSQLWLYVFSAILPIMCYLAITKWEGIKYARSNDSKAQEIGWIAISILAVSTIITFWLTAVWINGAINSATSSLNGTAGLSSYGF